MIHKWHHLDYKGEKMEASLAQPLAIFGLVVIAFAVRMIFGVDSLSFTLSHIHALQCFRALLFVLGYAWMVFRPAINPAKYGRWAGQWRAVGRALRSHHHCLLRITVITGATDGIGKAYAEQVLRLLLLLPLAPGSPLFGVSYSWPRRA